jgi:hypothetical protein
VEDFNFPQKWLIVQNKCAEHGLLEHGAHGIVTGILFFPDEEYLP